MIYHVYVTFGFINISGSYQRQISNTTYCSIPKDRNMNSISKSMLPVELQTCKSYSNGNPKPKKTSTKKNLECTSTNTLPRWISMEQRLYLTVLCIPFHFWCFTSLLDPYKYIFCQSLVLHYVFRIPREKPFFWPSFSSACKWWKIVSISFGRISCEFIARPIHFLLHQMTL